ncbi:MAG: hypothetical protein WCG48_03350 [Candidatus Berkelbacteria bacterium]
MKKNIAIILHLLIIIPAYTSSFWLDWRLVIAGVFLYYLQIWILGGCVLTYAQFGRWNESFSARAIMWLGSKLGLKLKAESVRRFLDLLPFILIFIALVYQIIFNGLILLSLKL